MFPIPCYVVTLIQNNNGNLCQVALKFSGAKTASFPSNHIIDWLATSSKLDSWILPSWRQHKQVKHGKISWRYFLKCSGNRGRMNLHYRRALLQNACGEALNAACPAHFVLCLCSCWLGNSCKQVMGWMRQSDLHCPSGFPSSSKWPGRKVNSTVIDT